MVKTLIFFIVLLIEVSAQDNIKSEIIFEHHTININNTNLDSSFNNYRTRHSQVNILLQAVVGEGMGTFLAMISFGIAFTNALSESGSKTTADIFGAITIPVYILGTAAGVHWIAHIENKKHLFWKTLEFAAIGSCVGAVITGILAASYNNIPDAGAVVIALTPLIGSLTYSLSFAEWQSKDQSVKNYKMSEINNSTILVKDIVERSQIIKINLLRLQL